MNVTHHFVLPNILGRHDRSKALICATLIGSVLGCADIESIGGSDYFEEKSFGVSENIYYSCEASIQSSDGARWSYRTPEVMNLMNEIKVHVTRDTDDFGQLKLKKIQTDTFSDGNLTLRLLQVGLEKSIEITHGRVGLVTSANQGKCISHNYSESGRNDTQITEFRLEAPNRCESPCSFSLRSNGAVARVEYRADQWPLAENTDAQNQFAISYTFNTAGIRTISATAFDRTGREIATDSRSVEVTLPQSTSSLGSSDGALNVPYYYQYNNRLYPASSCQNTSVAMVLNFLGVSVSPDDITARFGKEKAKSVSGLKEVFDTYAREHGVRSINSTGQGSFAQLRAALDQGSPVIVHGLFTSSGHVVVVTGYNSEGYFVNDPAGQWSQSFAGGYPGAWSEPTAGRKVFYRKAAFETAVGTLNGSTFEPLWMHSL